MIDSTTSEGLTRKTNFTEDDYNDQEEAIVRRDVARHHARHFLELSIKEYSKWFPGHFNHVSDALSHNYDHDYEELLKILCPSQILANFKIHPLPSTIVLWLTLLLQRLPLKEQLQEKHMKTMLGRGPDGSNGLDPLELSIIFS